MANTKRNYKWFFYLIENAVTREDGNRIAKVKSKKTKGIEDIAERIVQTRTEYRKDTLVNIYRMMNEAKMELLLEGEKVNDEFNLYEPTITGNFYDDPHFEESRHHCLVNTRITAAAQARFRRVKGVYNGLMLENGGALIYSITDITTGTINGEVTPGKTIIITGKKIRIVPEAGETTASCITYTNVDTLLEVEQENTPVVNDPSKVILQLPELAKGTYSLTIKTLFSNNTTLLTAPRYITAKAKLTVK